MRILYLMFSLNVFITGMLEGCCVCIVAMCAVDIDLGVSPQCAQRPRLQSGKRSDFRVLFPPAFNIQLQNSSFWVLYVNLYE